MHAGAHRPSPIGPRTSADAVIIRWSPCCTAPDLCRASVCAGAAVALISRSCCGERGKPGTRAEPASGVVHVDLRRRTRPPGLPVTTSPAVTNHGDELRIVHARTLRGPNVWHLAP